MSNIAASFVVPHFAAGPFDWANNTLSAMRSSALQLLQQPLLVVSDFLHLNDDPGHMGCVHPGRARHSVIDNDGYVVTDWKLNEIRCSASMQQQVDNAHLVTHNTAGMPSSQQQRDGAHILSGWTDPRPLGKDNSEFQEDIPLQVPPAQLSPGWQSFSTFVNNVVLVQYIFLCGPQGLVLRERAPHKPGSLCLSFSGLLDMQFCSMHMRSTCSLQKCKLAVTLCLGM